MKKAIMSVLTVWLLVSSMFIGLIGFGSVENVKAPYIPHNPIRINSNAEFASMAGSEGWAGNGLPGSPYIIEGYDINGSGYGYCIYIGNTTVYFEVRDCYLHEASGVGNSVYYPDSGIILKNVQRGTITNNTVSANNHNGIYIFDSDSNTIANNTVSSNTQDGIHLHSSNSNTIVNNTSLNNKYGFNLFLSSNNTINKNNATSNIEYGIILSPSSNSNTIINNTVSSNNWVGIYLYFTSSNILTNNQMVDNGITIWSDMLEHWNTHIIDTSNTVNGKPVQYWKNQTDGTVPPGAGQVILANSTYVIIENQNLNDSSIGIILGFSSNNTIANNTVSSNNCNGIVILFSSNNTIANNTASSNIDYGISLFSSNNNIIANNNASSNKWYGIRLIFSSNNTIANNTVSNNIDGIYIRDSSENSIYHNNIINNTNQAYDNTNNGNQWDNGYPSGGNYWSDYGGIDLNSTPSQNVPPPDGIGDTPYIIDADSQDNYPLMDPFTNRTFDNYMVLKQGWNLISIPLIQLNQDLETVLQMIEGYYDAVQWFDNSYPNKPWKHNEVGKPFGNDLSELNESMGFWIHITNPGDTIFLYNGTQPTANQSIPLHPGWNMVGYPSLSNKNRTAALNNITFGTEVDAIWTFNAAIQKWEEIGIVESFEVGRGYWIHATQECIWEVPI